mgnify:CR=1 FL=1
MKFKKLIFSLVFLFLTTESLFAKALPPGSGIGDVPANVLIMLDKSGSMGWRMSGGTASMRYPYDADADSNGDILVSQYNRDGVKKFVYASATTDSGFGNNGVSGKGSSKYEGNSNCRTSYSYSGEVYNDVYYTTAYYERSVVAIRASDGRCLAKYYLGGYPYNMTINQSTGILKVGHSGGFKTINLRNNQQYNCNVQTNLRYSYGTTVSGNYIYYYRSNRIYRAQLSSGTGCPFYNSNTNFYYPEGSYVGLEANPNNSMELWTLSWSMSRLKKINALPNGYTYTTQKTTGSRSMSASSTSNLYFYYPWGLGWDSNNNRILAANLNNGQVHVLDTNGTWIKSIGGAPKTRMQAAHEAILALVTDSSLTSGVDYGFAYWAHGSSGFSRWNGNHKTGTGSATPCSSYNCLKVPVYKGGAAQIAKMIKTVNPGGGTDAMAFMRIASQYYLNSTYTPIDKNSKCQKSYILVIGDGDWYNQNSAVSTARNLYNNHSISTFTVAFGTGISSSGLRNFNNLALAGGTKKAIVATTAAALTSQLKQLINQIIASKLSFTAPAITATIEEGGSLYQAQFDYMQNKEWVGTISRTKINPDGSLDSKDSGNWSAAEKLPRPSSRKIWSVIPGTDYKTDYNNFRDSNSTAIGNVFSIFGNDILDYHRDTNNSAGSSLNRRCANSPGVIDGTSDDLSGLINFIRGTDYFDYDGDCNLTEDRKNASGKKIYLGDIYHSQLLVVGPPSAETSFSGINQEAYFRSVNGYQAWKDSLSQRKEVIYAGSNSGILHAFDAETGVEKWGFVPPLVAPNLPLVMNSNLNLPGGGGTNAIFGVDGSIVVHDMYFKSPLDSAKKWHTILFAPYGRGGAGMSVLDITNPDKPLHLYSIYNDKINNRVYRVDHNQVIYNYDYISNSYSLASFEEAKTVTDKYNDNNSVSNTCNSSLNTSCYKGTTWTFPVQGVSKSDLSVTFNGNNYTSFSVTTNSSNDTVITFGQQMTYSADPGDTNTSSELGVFIKPGSKQTGVLTNPEYDYSQLGETWSDPRIFRIPNSGAGDTNILDDVYVAAMGGGFGTQFEGVGSNLTLINLEDGTNPMSLYKRIEIEDTATSDIINSVPSSIVLVTPDTARGLSFAGGLAYISDLEGKITKVNLTNMPDDGAGNTIKLYDKTTLFTAGSTKANGRYMYHAMDATIGDTTNTMWMFAGTGDYERINDTTSGVQNYMLGIKDRDYPLYKEVATPAKADDITNCKNTTNDTTGASCPKNADKGWYITLSNFAKVTAEPTVVKGQAYFPIYEPTKSLNKCSLGDAYICGVDDECGTNISSQLGQSMGQNNKCAWVGQGVLSKIVTFADKLFANIAGQVDCSKIQDAKKRKECEDSGKKDLISIDSGSGQVNTYRNSWRHNF